MDLIDIQAQDISGGWSTYSHTENSPLHIRNAMEQLKWQFPDRRVRAVDEAGRIVDFMP